MFLQREDPLIPVIHDEMIAFITELASKVMPVTAIRAINENFYDLEFMIKDTRLKGIHSVA